jgi:hypothetical protein
VTDRPNDRLTRPVSPAQSREGKGAARAVYIAPSEALAVERLADWRKRFGEGLGLNVVALTGEVTADNKLLEKVSSSGWVASRLDTRVWSR